MLHVFLTHKETGVVHWSRVGGIIAHVIDIPAVKAYKLLPLFEPLAVYQVPATKTKNENEQ